MLAPFAHHLGTAIVSLDWHTAHGAALDLGILSTAEGNAGIDQHMTHILPSKFLKAELFLQRKS